MSKEREDFENHLKKMGKTDNETFSKNEDDSYQMDIIHFGWKIWQAAKAQAVPEWKDYTVESPRIDGPYQIFIMDQQLVAKWESPWGFSSIEDGDAFNQELITHWSVLGSAPLTEPSSTSDCPDEP